MAGLWQPNLALLLTPNKAAGIGSPCLRGEADYPFFGNHDCLLYYGLYRLSMGHILCTVYIYIFTHVYTSMYMYMYMYMYVYIYIYIWITTQLFKWDVRDVYSTWTHGWRNHLWFQALVVRGYSSRMVSTWGLTIGAVTSTKSITPGLLIIGSAI